MSSTKYHEAAHALACILLGGTLHYVTMAGDDGIGETSGSVMGDWANAKFWLAGYVGEEYVTGSSSWDESHIDYEKGVSYAERAGKTVDDAIDATYDMLEPYVDLIRWIGDELEAANTLDGAEVRQIYAEWRDQGAAGNEDTEDAESSRPAVSRSGGIGPLLLAGAVAAAILLLARGGMSWPMAGQQNNQSRPGRLNRREVAPQTRQVGLSIVEGRSDCWEVSPGQIHCPR